MNSLFWACRFSFTTSFVKNTVLFNSSTEQVWLALQNDWQEVCLSLWFTSILNIEQNPVLQQNQNRIQIVQNYMKAVDNHGRWIITNSYTDCISITLQKKLLIIDITEPFIVTNLNKANPIIDYLNQN